MIPHLAASGAEALDLVRGGDPLDAAILDMQMPEMDGLTLAAEIRKLRATQSLPLVILTSFGRRESEAQMGLFAAFLTKPIKSSQLYNALIGIFAGQSAETALPVMPGQIDPHLSAQLP